MRRYIDDSDSDSDAPIRVYKRPRTGLPPTAPSTTVTTSAANVSAAAVQEDDFHGEMLSGDYSDDMEGLDEEPNQSEGEEESGPEGSDEEGSYNREEEEEGEDGEYQTDEEDEWSDEVDEINEGQAIGGRDIASNEVSYGNTAGSLGTKSSKMFGIFTDQDVLDCPICCEALTVPVSQCENGHIACSSCCLRIGYKCPSCSLRIGHIRCRPIERIINSVKFACPNLEYGCKEMVLYNDREVHGRACMFAPCSCPLESCDYVGSATNLYAHFRTKHLRSATQFNFKHPLRVYLDTMHKPVILQEKTDGTIFILNHADDTFPHAINLISIGTLHHTEEFCYELSVDHRDDTLTLKSVAATITKWSASQPLSKYLLVPTDFSYNDIISVKVCIEKKQ